MCLLRHDVVAIPPPACPLSADPEWARSLTCPPYDLQCGHPVLKCVQQTHPLPHATHTHTSTCRLSKVFGQPSTTESRKPSSSHATLKVPIGSACNATAHTLHVMNKPPRGMPGLLLLQGRRGARQGTPKVTKMHITKHRLLSLPFVAISDPPFSPFVSLCLEQQAGPAIAVDVCKDQFAVLHGWIEAQDFVPCGCEKGYWQSFLRWLRIGQHLETGEGGENFLTGPDSFHRAERISQHPSAQNFTVRSVIIDDSFGPIGGPPLLLLLW